MARQARVRTRGVAAAVALFLVAALLGGLTGVTPASARPDSTGAAALPRTSAGPAVSGVSPVPSRFVTPRDQAGTSYVPEKVRWPSPAQASIDLVAPAGRTMQGGTARGAGTPVWARAVADADGYTGPARLDVRVLDRAAARTADINGVLLSVTPGPGAGGRARIGLDYGSFAEAYGGNFGSRLRLVRLPGCVLTTPTVTACRQPSPLGSSNDFAGRSVSVEIPVGGAAAGLTVLAAVGDPGEEGGEGGTYAATDLKPSGSWAGGGSTGSFTYTYPIAVPPAASELVPAVDLGYDSGSVDGQTASTQAQASWVGDGWSTPRSYIEQTFASCKDNPGGKASPVSTPDRCYDGPILTMSLNGSSTSLVWDETKRVWKAGRDDGSVVTRVADSDNGSGTEQADYWRVTTRDGTVYEFGRNRLPGWTSGDPATNSVDHVPVYSPHPGDPCYDSDGFAESVCTMAYRWNLDHVTDVHGNAMAYYYKQDSNRYGRNRGATDVSYVRDSYLSRIDYGFRAGNAYGTVPNRIVFGTGPRCLAASCDPLTDATKANWPDVPYDLVCAAGKECETWSPSFFSTVRLTSITTQQYSISAAQYVTVDSYALTQTMPPTEDGTSPTLWLSSIQRTGHDTSAGGSGTLTLPTVSFGSVRLPNRTDAVDNGLPVLNRHRIESITSESGAVTTASYELPLPCSRPVTLDPATNTRSCYPVYWTPDGFVDPFRDWFNKYVVTRVTTTDPTGGAPATSTSWHYQGGAAWHFDDNEVVKPKYRTYGQFRGYAKVRTLNGDGVNDPQALTETTYHRGMSRNNNSTVVEVTDSLGGKHEDHDQLAGRELETINYLGDGGPADNGTITSYWVSAATASRSRDGLSALTANWVAPLQTHTRQAVTSGAATTWRTLQTDNSYDASVTSPTIGLLKHSYRHTVPADPAYDECTSYAYAPVNTGRNLVGLVSEVEKVSVACGGFTAGNPTSVPGGVNTLTAPVSVDRPARVVSHTRTFYDDPDFATTFPQPDPPSRGLATMTRSASTWANGAYTYHTTGRMEYDAYGRTTGVYDGNGNRTGTTYTMNAVGLTTASTVTNALEQSTSTTISPARGAALTTTDANGVVTRQQYDALGRSTAVWLYSRATTSPANHRFDYQVSKTGISAVTTQVLNNSSQYQTSTVIYDAQLRTRQTQAMTPQGGRMLTDTFYDSRGWVRATYNGWWDRATTPNTTLVTATDLGEAVPNQTFHTYDGLGRSVVEESAKNGVTVSKTVTVHAGDRSTVVPPDGGVVRTTVVDPLDRTTQLLEYTARPTVQAPANTFTGRFSVTGGTATTSGYGYDGHGNQATMTDDRSNVWTSTYDLLGRVTGKDDPDAGVITGMRYDGNGNLLQSTDARNKTVSYAYDKLNRKTGKYAGTVEAQAPENRLATWVYDNANGVAGVTNPIGRLTTSTAYWGGQPYVSQEKAFNVFGRSTGTTVTIPTETEGSALGGSYLFERTYTATTGLLLTEKFPARGTLPAETVLYGYSGVLDLLNTATSLASGAYLAKTTYDAWGRVEQAVFGMSPNQGAVTNKYDEHTGWLTEQLVSRTPTAPRDVDKQEYRYDLVGNLTQQISTRLAASSPTETQCFRYDGLRRLTAAWTATDACATAPTPGNRAMVGSTLAGSAYWTGWEFDTLGNRTRQTEYSVTGGTDTTTTYSYDGNGGGQPHTLTGTSGGSAGSTSYGYDTSGNLTSRVAGQGNQTLHWSDAGQLVSVTGGTSGDSSFLYDADGNLLLQKDPGTTTLYLPKQQLVLNTATQAVTGSRYYELPGGVSCVRTGGGSNFQFAIGDRHGTPSLYLNSTAQTPTWRQYTPYGAPRGAAVTVPDNRGFLNKPMNASTGLTRIGARDYDPALGRFITVDPILDEATPQNWNGYAYAGNNPISYADPSGLIFDDETGEEYNGRLQDHRNGGGTAPARPPRVASVELSRILSAIYAKPTARNFKGVGKTGDAIRSELFTGNKTKGLYHSKEGAEQFAALSDLLERNRKAIAGGEPPLLTPDEEGIARREARELWGALNQEDKTGRVGRYYAEENPGAGKELQSAMRKGATRPAVADIVGSAFSDPKMWNGRQVKPPRLTQDPRYRGFARGMVLMDVAPLVLIAILRGPGSAVDSLYNGFIEPAFPGCSVQQMRLQCGAIPPHLGQA